MALVERLMGLDPTGTVPDDANKIPVHDFFAASHEIIMGRLTVAQVKAALAMDVATAAEFDVLVATAPTGSSATALANKSLYVSSMHSVFILAEKRYAGYATPAQVRTKLGI